MKHFCKAAAVVAFLGLGNAVHPTSARQSLIAADNLCPGYTTYSAEKHEPLSSGRHKLSYMRPIPACRTFKSSIVESTIERLKSKMADPDLARLFENSFPNTLDTTISWRGVAADNVDEELAFVITGDIRAMWLRDSANQMLSYLSLLPADNSPTGLRSIYRGVINLQARYLLDSPYCNAFQAPTESGIPPAVNYAPGDNKVQPPYDNKTVFECKYELDSLAAFLAISTGYYSATGDSAFFLRFKWVAATKAILRVARVMQTSTYSDDGAVINSPYVFSGIGVAPAGKGTGLVRSAFRPSDDNTIFQFFIPPNMMFSAYLAGGKDSTGSSAAAIADAIGEKALAAEMRAFAAEIQSGIETYAVVQPARVPGDKSAAGSETVYAYEIDGFGSSYIMDDANVPSLLSTPLLNNYTSVQDPLYQRTRQRVLSAQGNPYYAHGSVLNAVGGPHVGPGKGWPMASIVRALTSTDKNEVVSELRQLVGSTDGLGLIHESVASGNESDWTRQWFAWANGLFGQLMLDLEEKFPAVLDESYQ